MDLGTGLTADSVAYGNHYGCAVLNDSSLKSGEKRLDKSVTEPRCDKSSPVSIGLGTGRTAEAVAVHNAHTCALLDDGSVKCWGDDSYGELGNGAGVTDSTSPPSTTVDLGTGRTAVALDVGADHTCAVLDNGSLVLGSRPHRTVGQWSSHHSKPTQSCFR